MSTPIDKFKIIETAPFFEISPTGSYSSVNSGFKSAYVLKFKDPNTKNVIRTSGIVGNNSKVPPIPPTTPPITILKYSNNSAGPNFVWSDVTWTLDNTLPEFSYSANAVDLNTQNGPVPNNTSLINVAIGTLVTNIGDASFYGCTSLTSITIPNSVTNIENSAFNSCTSLTSIIIPDSVTSIGVYSFQDCTGLTSITISDSVMSIANTTFAGCISLTYVKLSNSLTSIGNYAFLACTSLTSITIPNLVTSIGDNAFLYSGLETVYISANNPLGIISPSLVNDFYGATNEGNGVTISPPPT